MERTTVSFTPEQLDILIDCIHSRFMNVATGAEPHPQATKLELLDQLSRLHAAVQFSCDKAEAKMKSIGQA